MVFRVTYTSHAPTLSSVVRRFTGGCRADRENNGTRLMPKTRQRSRTAQLLSKFRTSFISAHGAVFYRFMGTWCCKDAVAMRL